MADIERLVSSSWQSFIAKLAPCYLNEKNVLDLDVETLKSLFVPLGITDQVTQTLIEAGYAKEKAKRGGGPPANIPNQPPPIPGSGGGGGGGNNALNANSSPAAQLQALQSLASLSGVNLLGMQNPALLGNPVQNLLASQLSLMSQGGGGGPPHHHHSHHGKGMRGAGISHHRGYNPAMSSSYHPYGNGMKGGKGGYGGGGGYYGGGYKGGKGGKGYPAEPNGPTTMRTAYSYRGTNVEHSRRGCCWNCGSVDHLKVQCPYLNVKSMPTICPCKYQFGECEANANGGCRFLGLPVSTCANFLAGKCDTKDCQFAHIAAPGCPHVFQKGSCNYGDQCLLIDRPCDECCFATCIRGDSCPRRHDFHIVKTAEDGVTITHVHPTKNNHPQFQSQTHPTYQALEEGPVKAEDA